MKYEKASVQSIKDFVLKENGVESIEALEEWSEIHFKNQCLFDSFVGAGEKIAVIGDYDVDGIMATAILTEFLRLIGKTAVPILPNRFTNGYGLKKALVDEAASRGAASIITVDNGIAACDAVAYAEEKGMKVFVTDHHRPGDAVPSCEGIVDPLLDESIAFKGLCGAEVAYFLARDYLLGCGKGDEGFLTEARQLATVAVISDVMPLRGINRMLVKKLLEEARKKQISNPALSYLFEKSSPDSEGFSEDTLGFQVCPMLNAPGRIKSPLFSLAFILEKDEAKVKERFDQLDALNGIRKQLTAAMMADLKPLCEGPVQAVLSSLTSKSREGIIGIAAGRLTEETDRPAFVFALAEDGTLKGSGRSPANYDLISGARRVIPAHPEIGVLGCGGHSGAMGITLRDAAGAAEFGRLMSEDYALAKPEPLVRRCLSLDDLGLTPEQAASQLQSLAPFGEGFEAPVFACRGKTYSVKPLGKGLSFSMIRNGNFLDFKWFDGKSIPPQAEVWFSLMNHVFRGKSSPECTVLKLQALE